MKGKAGKRKRRVSAINQREGQLKAGTKPQKIEGKSDINKQIPLTDKDRTRINQEIVVLKKKAA